MSASRKFLWLPFWLAVLLTALGYVILYPLVARLGCFLLAAGLCAGGVFITERGHRIAAALLFIVALASAYVVYRHGQKYLSSYPPIGARVMAKAPNERAAGDGRMTLLFSLRRRLAGRASARELGPTLRGPLLSANNAVPPPDSRAQPATGTGGVVTFTLHSDAAARLN